MAQKIILVPVKLEFRPFRATWSILRNDSRGGELLQPSIVSGKQRKLANPWQMRKEFFQLKRGNTDALLKFLNTWGSWQSWSSSRPESANRIWGTWESFRRAVKQPAGAWLKNDINGMMLMVKTDVSEYPYHLLSLAGCELAMRMTITVDLLQKVKFKICEREDCGAPFPVESQHVRRYCSQYCGHLVSVRRGRKEQKSHAAR